MKDVIARMSEATRAQIDALYRTVEVDIEVDPGIAEGEIRIQDSSGFTVAIYRLEEFKKDKKKGKGIFT